MAKMWAGRFSKEVDEKVNDFNSSISFDCRMYRQDILGSIAHATMLGETGIIDKQESEIIIQGLKEILADIESGSLPFDPTAEAVSYTHLRQAASAVAVRRVLCLLLRFSLLLREMLAESIR